MLSKMDTSRLVWIVAVVLCIYVYSSEGKLKPDISTFQVIASY